ncbi:MAG: DUF4255 domain-containing protein [Actinomycetota bacterium]
MIHDVDQTLRDLIERLVVAGGDVEVSLDAPTRDWAARQNRPTINAFLYDIREDTGRRDVAPRAVYDENRRIIGREAPPRRFRLSYLLTAWTQRPEDEHRLLSSLLSTFLGFDQVPGGDDGFLAGSLATSTVPTIVTLALPPPQDRSLSDIWSALGGELKPSLDLVVVAPIEPGRTYETGPPVTERPTVRLGEVDMEPDDVEAERRRRATLRHVVAVEDVPERAGAERRQVGDDEHPGRTFTFTRLNDDD